MVFCNVRKAITNAKVKGPDPRFEKNEGARVPAPGSDAYGGMRPIIDLPPRT